MAQSGINDEFDQVKERISNSLNSTQQDFQTITTATQSSARSTLSGFRDTQSVLQMQQQSISQQQTTFFSQLHAQIGRMHSDLTQQIASLSITEFTNGDIVFEGVGVEAITLPLMLMMSPPSQAMETVCLKGRIGISQSEASLLRCEFENLLASCHEASAQSAKARADSLYTLSGQAASRPTRSRARGFGHAMPLAASDTLDSEQRSLRPQPKLAFEQRRTYTCASSAGLLILQTNNDSSESTQSVDQIKQLSAIRLRFIPRSNVCSTGVSAVFFSTKKGVKRSLYWSIYPRI